MATIASDPLKARLMGSGLWGDFVRMRQDVMEREGIAGRAAGRKVLAELDPEAVPLLRGRGKPPGKAKRESAEAGAVKAEAAKTLSDVRRENRDLKAASAAVAASGVKRVRCSDGGFVVTKETFAGKSCPYTVSLNWAYSNHRIEDISPEDAPSAVAWNLLLDMRESPSIKADVLKGWSNAMARKAEADEQDGSRFDGEGEYDLLARLAGAADAGGAG